MIKKLEKDIEILNELVKEIKRRTSYRCYNPDSNEENRIPAYLKLGMMGEEKIENVVNKLIHASIGLQVSYDEFLDNILKKVEL